MTEEEWFACDTLAILAHLRGRASDRKFWLFACACFRSPGVWPGLAGRKVLKQSIWEVEQNGGPPPGSRFRSFPWPGGGSASDEAAAAVRSALDVAAHRGLESVNLDWADGYLVEQSNRQWEAERVAQRRYARDIFGNPFRPVTLDPAWRTPTVVQLSQGIYDERAFDRMPILADALQDAGCDSDGVLSHCRDARREGVPGEPAGGFALTSGEGVPGEPPGGSPVPTVHVRGCWVVDLVLGKA